MNGCGDSLEELGRPAEALAYFHAARTAWKKVVDDNPARYAEPVELGTTHNRIGWLLFGMGRMNEALEQYEAARSVFQKLLDTFPPHLLAQDPERALERPDQHRRDPAQAGATGRGEGELRRGDRDPGGRDQGVPGGPGLSLRMGECLLRSGQVRLAAGDIAGATADWRQALLVYAGLPRRGGEIALFEAGCHAMLSSVAGMSGSGVPAAEGASETEKAMAILHQAIAEGYHAPELKNRVLPGTAPRPA